MSTDTFALLLIVLLKFLVRNCTLVSDQIDNIFHLKHPVNAMVGLSTQTKMDHTKLAGYHNRHGRTTQAYRLQKAFNGICVFSIQIVQTSCKNLLLDLWRQDNTIIRLSAEHVENCRDVPKMINLESFEIGANKLFFLENQILSRGPELSRIFDNARMYLCN